jgi:hypothetical protein
MLAYVTRGKSTNTSGATQVLSRLFDHPRRCGENSCRRNAGTVRIRSAQALADANASAGIGFARCIRLRVEEINNMARG